MARWAGLGRRYPLVGVVFSLFLLAFAGIPLTSGFVSKFAVFKAAAEGGAMPLVIVGVIASAVAAYFYVRVIVLMFFTDPPEDAPDRGGAERAEHGHGHGDRRRSRSRWARCRSRCSTWRTAPTGSCVSVPIMSEPVI